MTSESDPTLTSHAEASFDPALYVSLFSAENISNEPESRWTYDQIHDIFKEGALKGQKLLDIGSGPVVYPVITASKWFDEVYLSDCSKDNIDYLHKWMRGESEHMRPLMEYYAQKEENVTWEQKNSQVRNKVKGAVECDVNKPNPLAGTLLENAKFDVITSCLCLHVAALTIDDFKKALQNISKLLKPGGHLVVADILDNKFYAVGDKKFRAFSTTLEELQTAYKESGYVIEQWNSTSFAFDYTVCDASTMYTVLAKKL